jgi:hypothetical protein
MDKTPLAERAFRHKFISNEERRSDGTGAVDKERHATVPRFSSR